MRTIFERDYKSLAEKLLEAIGEKDFLNSEIHIEGERDLCTLKFTLIVYRNMETKSIERIIPVWWECAWYIDGVNVPNDFTWIEFNKHLNQ